MAAQNASPPASPSSSPKSKAKRTPLSIDLSSLPPLISPSPPSNTLLITNLLDPEIFSAPSLEHIRSLITAREPPYSFSPLRSLRRIIVSFPTTEAAISVRQLLDTSPLLASTAVRIYFGEPTPVEPTDQYLHAPKSQKLFFISPPPSPPHGWMVRDEEPPNRDVHAQDLAIALAGLGKKRTDDAGEEELGERSVRSRSGSRSVVYDPQEHGDSPLLPAVMVEDTTESPIEGTLTPGDRIMAHTSRPPVELLNES